MCSPNHFPDLANDGSAKACSRGTGPSPPKRRASSKKTPKTPPRKAWPKSARSPSSLNRTTSKPPCTASRIPTSLRRSSLSFALYYNTVLLVVPCLHLPHLWQSPRHPWLRLHVHHNHRFLLLLQALYLLLLLLLHLLSSLIPPHRRRGLLYTHLRLLLPMRLKTLLP